MALEVINGSDGQEIVFTSLIEADREFGAPEEKVRVPLGSSNIRALQDVHDRAREHGLWILENFGNK